MIYRRFSDCRIKNITVSKNRKELKMKQRKQVKLVVSYDEFEDEINGMFDDENITVVDIHFQINNHVPSALVEYTED